MTTDIGSKGRTRPRLTRERVLQAAVDYADDHGIEELSMRKLGAELGVEAMSLYHHVRNKDEILDGMVDLFAREIEFTSPEGDWQADLRRRILTAREAVHRHPWLPEVIQSRERMSIPILQHYDAVGAIMLDGGFSVDLMHHAFHVLGSRILGFTQELYDDKDDDAVTDAQERELFEQMRPMLPNIARVMDQIQHDEASIVGSGCDDDVEFVFALDLILDGLERRRAAEAAVERT